MSRSPSTISREIRHATSKGYNAEVAQWYAQQNAHYRKSGKHKLTEGSNVIDVSQLIPGTYALRLTGENGQTINFSIVR